MEKYYVICTEELEESDEIYGVIRLGIFGSVARGDVTAASDVDMVVEMENPDLFYMVHIKEDLEKALRCPVDIVHYRARMNNFF